MFVWELGGGIDQWILLLIILFIFSGMLVVVDQWVSLIYFFPLDISVFAVSCADLLFSSFLLFFCWVLFLVLGFEKEADSYVCVGLGFVVF